MSRDIFERTGKDLLNERKVVLYAVGSPAAVFCRPSLFLIKSLRGKMRGWVISVSALLVLGGCQDKGVDAKARYLAAIGDYDRCVSRDGRPQCLELDKRVLTEQEAYIEAIGGH
ncbi:hypothetical protein BSN85_34950 [Bradyrhizobium brasilense]|uniref:hypothetical protein n=1 Tax=Bradyrhizobium brasilense TaxID=1419277 RepID=UPI000976237A|nr:hypothetical protein [Bradyrhizobium brasilense]OMI00267.1 hypothetical protein BSN85_34950 [Bradyrhizobium brasilense]